MTRNFRVFLIGLGAVFLCFLLFVAFAIIDRERSHESTLAGLKKAEAELQELRNKRIRFEAERAGEKAVREYDAKHASYAELMRMDKARMREIERLNAIIRVEKELKQQQ